MSDKTITSHKKVNTTISNKEIRHDLKNPLAVISGYSQLILKKHENSNSKEERWANKIYDQVNKLVEMINNLLSD